MTKNSKHPQRKRFKPKKPKKPRVKREPKPKKIKKPITCGHKHGTVCEKHGNPCAIEIEWPEDDERSKFKKALVELGAPEHDEHSDHRCIECMRERFENSPHKHLEVMGLNEMQSNRLSGFTLKPSPEKAIPLKAPKNTD